MVTVSSDIDRWRLLIDGQLVDTPNHYDIIDPNTAELVGRAPDGGRAEAESAIAAARRALPQWAALSMWERCTYIREAADAIQRESGTWIELVQAETGSTGAVARTLQAAGALIDRFNYYGKPQDLDGAIPPMFSPASTMGPASLLSASTRYKPVGVVGCITSYNFPLANVAGKVAPALAMGNTVIIKPAPQDPLTVLLLSEVLNRVFPPGVVNTIVGSGPDTASALVESPNVNMVSFTGSTAVGRSIYQNGGPTMKRLLMELGGKGALIMTDDANVQDAVRGASTTWTFHSGQVCTAPTRLICHRSIYDETVEALQAIASSLVVGDTRDESTVIGPVISELHRSRVENHIQIGVAEGARLVAGGTRPSDLDGFVVPPALLVDCEPDMRIVREEVFGPVLVVLPHDGDEQAAQIANNSNYGLANYVYSSDPVRAHKLAAALESGSVALNSISPHMYAPFGGFKMSGIGRDRGRWGLEAYSELQAISWGT